MKTLLVFRHAKARRAGPGTDDHARPLSESGEEDARDMGRLLRREGLVPDLVLTSTAVRAETTARLAAESGEFSDRVEDVDGLYEAGPEDCLDLVRRRGGGHDRVMLVGHNPTFEALVRRMGRGGEAMPTGAVARVAADVAGWGELEPAFCRVLRVWRPGEAV